MPSPLLSLLIAVGFVICWSSGFVGGRLATQADMPVLALFAWRFLLASLLTGVWWRFRHDGSLAPRDVIREATIGCLTMGGYLLGIILALALGVSTGVTALIAALQPLLAATLAGHWLGERQGARGWLGMAIATAGVLISVLDDIEHSPNSPLWAYLLPLFSVVSVTLGSMLAARWKPDMPISTTLLTQLLVTSALFMLAALVEGGGGIPLPSADMVSMAAIGWLVVLSSLGGYGFFVASLRRLGVTQTSILVYLTPAVTLLWAAVMFDERPGPQGIAGMAVVAVGVGLAIHSARTSGPTRRAPDARHAARTWSTAETRDAAHRALSPRWPRCDSPVRRP